MVEQVLLTFVFNVILLCMNKSLDYIIKVLTH